MVAALRAGIDGHEVLFSVQRIAGKRCTVSKEHTTLTKADNDMFKGNNLKGFDGVVQVLVF